MNVFHRLLGQARQAGQAKQAKQARLAQYNTYDARNVFCQLVRRVRRGEEIVIAHAGRPVAKLVPYAGGAPTRPGVIRAHLVVHDATPEPAATPPPARARAG